MTSAKMGHSASAKEPIKVAASFTATTSPRMRLIPCLGRDVIARLNDGLSTQTRPGM
jgi:hypothetical protein